MLDLVGALAEREALTVLVLDDAQWSDELSAATLQFAIRRLTNERVATLLAARPGMTTLFNDVTKVEVSGVDTEVCRSILSVGGADSMEVASGAREVCGGNPFVLRQLGAERAHLIAPPRRIPIHPSAHAVSRAQRSPS